MKNPGGFDNALGSDTETIAAYQPAIEARFYDGSVLGDLGSAFKENGDHSAAIECVKTAMKKCSVYEHLWAQLCDCSVNEDQDNGLVRRYEGANQSTVVPKISPIPENSIGAFVETMTSSTTRSGGTRTRRQSKHVGTNSASVGTNSASIDRKRLLRFEIWEECENRLIELIPRKRELTGLFILEIRSQRVF